MLFALICLCALDLQLLVQELGNDDFYKREKASKILAGKMNFETMMYLKKISETEKDLEIRRRIDYLVCDYRRKLKSEYTIDLKGYKAWPIIDHGMPKDYKLDGVWKGWVRQTFINRYVRLANMERMVGDGGPLWMEYRRATRILTKERIDYCFEESIKDAKCEKDFREAMKKKMENIQKDIEMLIQGDKDYYKTVKQKNPFERD